MSAQPHPRFPLVFGSARATDDARRLLPRRLVLENLVTTAIGAGFLSHEPRNGRAADVYLDEHGVVAEVVRTRSPLTGRKAFKVTALRPTTHATQRRIR